MRFDRIVAAVAAAAALSGCSLLGKLQPNCHHPQDYQRVREVSPLTVPPGLDKPNTSGALTIPTVELAPPPPGPKDACLDVPPRYQAAPANKAASSG